MAVELRIRAKQLYVEDLGEVLDLGAEGLGVRRFGALFEMRLGEGAPYLYPAQFLVRDGNA